MNRELIPINKFVNQLIRNNMKKYLKIVSLLAIVGVGFVGFAMAQTKGVFSDIEQFVPTTGQEANGVDTDTKNRLTSGTLNPYKSTYVFGNLGSTTNGKSSTVTTIGIGHDVLTLNNGHIILGVEGALTHFSGKRLDSVNNKGNGGYATVKDKNLIELGAKVSYQFDQIDPLNVRVFGKVGIASSTLKNTDKISPFVGAGVEFNVDKSNFVWVVEAKHYTDLRKADVYYNENRGSDFNTRKNNTVVSVGLQYRF